MRFKDTCDECGEGLVVYEIPLRYGIPVSARHGFFVQEVESDDIEFDDAKVRCSGCGKDYKTLLHLDKDLDL